MRCNARATAFSIATSGGSAPGLPTESQSQSASVRSVLGIAAKRPAVCGLARVNAADDSVFPDALNQHQSERHVLVAVVQVSRTEQRGDFWLCRAAREQKEREVADHSANAICVPPISPLLPEGVKPVADSVASV
jgi:hypothetical protein